MRSVPDAYSLEPDLAIGITSRKQQLTLANSDVGVSPVPTSEDISVSERTRAADRRRDTVGAHKAICPSIKLR
jgi:hypothetical protein